MITMKYALTLHIWHKIYPHLLHLLCSQSNSKKKVCSFPLRLKKLKAAAWNLSPRLSKSFFLLLAKHTEEKKSLCLFLENLFWFMMKMNFKFETRERFIKRKLWILFYFFESLTKWKNRWIKKNCKTRKKNVLKIL